MSLSSATLMPESTPSLTAQSDSDIASLADMGDGVLSEDQIDVLLRRAEASLRERQGFLQKLSSSGSASGSLPLSSSSSSTLQSSNGISRLDPGLLPAPYLRSSAKVVKPEARGLVSEEQRQLAEKTRKIDDPITIKQQKEKATTSGLSTHFDLPRTKITPELKRDLQLLHMRSVLDPKRMYKKQGKFKIPEYSQTGVIVEGPTEFFSARLNNRERKRTLVDDTLEKESENGRFKQKYEELQVKHRSGRKGYLKELKARRKTRKG